MIQAIERYMKQAIVDRNPSVASAALVSAMVSYNLYKDFMYVNYYTTLSLTVNFKQRR